MCYAHLYSSLGRFRYVHITTDVIFSRDLSSKLNYAPGRSITSFFVNVWTHCSAVVRRRIEVRFSYRLLVKGAILSEPELAMIDISLLPHVLSGSIVKSSAGESNTASARDRV